MAPEFFGTIAKHLKSEQIVDGQGFERLIIENLSELALLQLPNSMMNWQQPLMKTKSTVSTIT